jgi:hypothetical protein
VGIASPTAGRVDFQPAVYDELIPSGRSQALTGLQAIGMPPRIASRNDNKQAVPFGFQVITLDSDGGVIEIAASPTTLKKIQDAVEPAPRSLRAQDPLKDLAPAASRSFSSSISSTGETTYPHAGRKKCKERRADAKINNPYS